MRFGRAVKRSVIPPSAGAESPTPESVLISGAGIAGPTHGWRSARRSGARADARTVFGGNERRLRPRGCRLLQRAEGIWRICSCSVSNLQKLSRPANIFGPTIALLCNLSDRWDGFRNRRINSGRVQTIAAIQPRRGAFAASPQIPCSAPEQDENSLFRTLECAPKLRHDK